MYDKSMEATHLDGQLVSLPGRYAKTLFDLGADSKKLQKIRDNLAHLHQVFTEVDNFKSLLLNPSVTKIEQVSILEAIAEKYNYEQLFLQFMVMLCENNRLSHFERIRSIFNDLLNEVENVKEVQVTSFVALSNDQKKKLQEILSRQSSARLDFNFKLDPSILGGVLIKAGSQIIDITIANQINMLATEMKGKA